MHIKSFDLYIYKFYIYIHTYILLFGRLFVISNHLIFLAHNVAEEAYTSSR